jgi:hypothetical protein
MDKHNSPPFSKNGPSISPPLVTPTEDILNLFMSRLLPVKNAMNKTDFEQTLGLIKPCFPACSWGQNLIKASHGVLHRRTS